MNEAPTFDLRWEDDIYSQGQQLNRYPWDMVVSFVFKHAPRDRPRHEVRILEVGCGAGNNLWFAAREGFQVAGVDGSASAIAYARQRFAKERLEGDLRVADFAQPLPFADAAFDLAIDRGALVCVGLSAGRRAVAEVRRVLRAGGRFLFNPYSRRHMAYTSGEPGPDGTTINMALGTCNEVGQLCFYGRPEVDAALADGWRVLTLEHVESVDYASPEPMVSAFWKIVAEKVA